MDRQPLTDRLGDRLLAEYGGAAAAYSLRALNGNGDSVVRVRRASDNDEKDFTAEQIELGELTNWVNSQIVPPLDIGVETSDGRIPVPEGGTSIGTPAAAYSLRNLSTTYTGNVVKVRRNSDDTEADFTAVEVSDGTLLAWVNADVVTYTSDFSAGVDGWSADPASSATTTSNPVGAGDVLKYTIDTETAAKYLSLNSLNVGQQYSVQAEVYVPSSNVDLDSIVLMDGSGFMATSYLGIQRDEWVPVSTVGTANLSNINIRGASGTTASAYNGFQGNGTDVFYVRNVVITQTTADGHVSTWYDQSGNTNHAVQTTAASQPKIVEGGSLVTGGIDFDGVDDFMQAAMAVIAQPISGFSVFKNDSLTFAPSIWDSTSVTNRVISYSVAADNTFRISAGTALISATGAQVNGTDYQRSDFFNSTSSSFYANGTVMASGDAGTNSMEGLTIGARYDGTVNFTDGTIAELIIYDSDQSDNRTAIEANIGETYGITGIPAYDNTVDGFVETWYDQSGNGNDATQSVAGNQPKIVDGGSLVTDANGKAAIRYDGTSDYMVASTGGISTGTDFLFSQVGKYTYSDIQDIAWRIASGLSDPRITMNLTAGNVNSFDLEDDTLNFAVTPLGDLSSQNLLTEVYSTADTIEVFKNGSSVGSDDVSAIATDENFGDDLYLGARWGGDYNAACDISEFIIYNSDQSANRTAIEDNINAHYNIYP